MEHEKARFTQGYGGKVKIRTGFVEERCVNEELRSPMLRALGAWMPRRFEVTVKKKFRQLKVSAVDDDEEAIAAVNDEANDGIVRVTADSGAPRSVWPRRKKGVLRRKLDKKPKDAVANGTMIEVYRQPCWNSKRKGISVG